MKTNITNPLTLEALIEDLDNRGLMVLLVLLGQQAMKILTEDRAKDNKSNIIDPGTKDKAISLRRDIQ